jgi:hypothetical protein
MDYQYNLDLPRLPLLPTSLLRAHRVFEPMDTRFRAAARLLQALWREDHDLPIGTHRPPKGRRRRIGSRISIEAGEAGQNFMTPDIARLVAQELAYREPGAMIDEDRLKTNMLSSMPLCFNLLGILKQDLDLASRTFRSLWPAIMDTVDGIHFEHSPGRGNPRYTGDHTAFDALVTGRSPTGDRTFIAVEVKYAETMWEPVPALRPRLDELSGRAELFIDPDNPQLRQAPIQQLWRQHLLASTLTGHAHFSAGLVLVIAPAMNNAIHHAVRRYQSNLKYAEHPRLGFKFVALESFILTLADAGAADYARALYRRYCDFLQVEGELSLHLAEAFGGAEPGHTEVPRLTDRPAASTSSTDTSAAA